MDNQVLRKTSCMFCLLVASVSCDGIRVTNVLCSLSMMSEVSAANVPTSMAASKRATCRQHVLSIFTDRSLAAQGVELSFEIQVDAVWHARVDASVL